MDSTSSSTFVQVALSLLDQGNTFLINGRYDAAASSYSNAIDSLDSASPVPPDVVTVKLAIPAGTSNV